MEFVPGVLQKPLSILVPQELKLLQLPSQLPPSQKATSCVAMRQFVPWAEMQRSLPWETVHGARAGAYVASIDRTEGDDGVGGALGEIGEVTEGLAHEGDVR